MNETPKQVTDRLRRAYWSELQRAVDHPTFDDLISLVQALERRVVALEQKQRPMWPTMANERAALTAELEQAVISAWGALPFRQCDKDFDEDAALLVLRDLASCALDLGLKQRRQASMHKAEEPTP